MTEPAPAPGPFLRLHASCVAVEGVGVLIRGASGAGKSDLALRLVDRGGVLVADDQVIVRAAATGDGGSRLLASAPPALAGLIEVRGMGIARLPHLAETALGLLVDLRAGGEAERLPEPWREEVLGHGVPGLRLDPFHASADARIRLAVRGLILP